MTGGNKKTWVSPYRPEGLRHPKLGIRTPTPKRERFTLFPEFLKGRSFQVENKANTLKISLCVRKTMRKRQLSSGIKFRLQVIIEKWKIICLTDNII
jgi:hypothetical protein